MSTAVLLPLPLKHRLIVRAANLVSELVKLQTQIGRDHIEFVLNGTIEARSNRNYATIKAQVILEEMADIRTARNVVEAVGGF